MRLNYFVDPSFFGAKIKDGSFDATQEGFPRSESAMRRFDAIEDSNDIDADLNDVGDDADQDLNPAESERNAKMMKGFKLGPHNSSEMLTPMLTPMTPTQVSNNDSAFPWLGPIRLPWNLSSLTTHLSDDPTAPVKVVLNVDSVDKKSPVTVKIYKDPTLKRKKIIKAKIAQKQKEENLLVNGPQQNEKFSTRQSMPTGLQRLNQIVKILLTT